MKTQTKCDNKNIKNLNLKGVEIISFIEGSGGTNLTSITLKDSVTGTELTFQMSQYSEFILVIDKPPVIEKNFIVTGKINNGKADVSQIFKTKGEAEDFVENQDWADMTITEREERIA